MTDLATLEELKNRLDWELDADEERIATSALEDASEQARFYGASGWSDTVCPPYAKTLVLRACARYMSNPSGYTQSRAGDETLTWGDSDPDMGTVHFTEQERKQLAEMAGRSSVGLVSVDTVAWGTDLRRRDRNVSGRVGPPGVGLSFPLFCSDTSPWCECGNCR